MARLRREGQRISWRATISVLSSDFAPRQAPATATHPQKPPNDPDRLVLRKYDPVVRRHVDFREER